MLHQMGLMDHRPPRTCVLASKAVEHCNQPLSTQPYLVVCIFKHDRRPSPWPWERTLPRFRSEVALIEECVVPVSYAPEKIEAPMLMAMRSGKQTCEAEQRPTSKLILRTIVQGYMVVVITGDC